MKNLYIYILATDVYKEYLKAFFISLNNLNVNYNLVLNILTDEEKYSEYIPKEKISEVNYILIPNFPYPYNTLLKLDYIFHNIKTNKLYIEDYFMFFDADSIIRKKDNFDFLEKIFSSNKLFFTISPWSPHSGVAENKNSKNTPYYIEDDTYCKEKYIQASFFGGNILSFLTFYEIYFNKCQEINKWYKNQERKIIEIPYLYDQTIINKILSENSDNYIIDYFINNNYESNYLNRLGEITKYEFNSEKGPIYENSKYETCFVLQKFNIDIKDSKRFFA